MQNKKEKKTTKPFMIISFLIIGAALIIYVFFGTTYTKAQQEQDDINFQIDQLWPMVQQGIPAPSDDQEKRLTAAQSKLDEQRAAFPTKMGSTEIMETLLHLAQQNNVSLALQTQITSSGSTESSKYHMLYFTVQATGSFNGLLAFVGQLEEGPIQTLSIEQINLSQTGNSWTATFNMSIYTQYPSSAKLD